MQFLLKLAHLDLMHLRPSDRRPALMLTFYFFLAMASVILIKSLQNAIYIGQIGVGWQLPALYVALALFSGPIVLLYRYLAKRYSHLLLTTATLSTLAAGLLLFWFFRFHAGEWIYHVFYLWCAVFTVLVPTQGWFISYHLFSPRTAKRVFVVLGMGGVLGGVFGGYYTFLIAPLLGSLGLFIQLLIFLAILEVVMILVFATTRARKKAGDKTSRIGGAPDRPRQIKKVFHSRYLASLAGLILITAFTSTLIDLHFKWAVEKRFGGLEEQITQFFGGFLGTVFLLSALIQLMGTSRILRNFGLGLGLIMLPVGLMLGATGVILTAAFWAIVAAKTIDGSFRSSIEQTSVELLYVPISERENIPIKSFMELVVLRLGDGLGAALFLLFTSLGAALSTAVPIVILVIGLVWLLLTRVTAEEYAQLLRRSLESIDSRTVRRALDLDEAVAENTLLNALESKNLKKVHFALQQLHSVEPESDVREISTTELSGEILSMDFSGLVKVRTSIPRWLKSIQPFVEHEDDRVAAAALRLILNYDLDGSRRKLIDKLNSEGVPERRILIFLQDYSDDPGDLLSPSTVLKWGSRATVDQAISLAKLMGNTRNPIYLPMLRSWLGGPNRRLKRAALRAIGQYADPADIDLLISYLPRIWSRSAARRALMSFGNEVVGRLLGLLRDPQVELEIKRQIPFILAQINTSSARGVLVAALYSYDAVVAFRALKGLNKIRDESSLSYSQDSFIPLLQIWAKEYYGLVNIEVLLRTQQSPAARLLRKALKERINSNIEKIFRGLDLFLPHGDAYFSYLGFTSSRQDLKDNAIELIDSRIKGELRQTLLPIFSEYSTIDVVRKGREIFKLPSNPEAALLEVFFQGDPWLKCCVITAIKEEKVEELKGQVVQACDDINPIVRQTAQWALASWESAA